MDRFPGPDTVSYCHHGNPPIQAVGKCAYCDEPIYVNEEYADVYGNSYHKECLEEFSIKDWLDILGVSIKEAELPDVDD